jgi:hypothetical protein
MKELIEIIKEWAGLATVVVASVWGIAELYFKWHKSKEDNKQEHEQTTQAEITTEERELELDSRRVEKSEEVASKALEHSAELVEDNLELLKDKYQKDKTILTLEHKIDKMDGRIEALEETVKQLQEERAIIAYFFCGNVGCKIREPRLGEFQFGCLSLETLKRIKDNGTEVQA